MPCNKNQTEPDTRDIPGIVVVGGAGIKFGYDARSGLPTVDEDQQAILSNVEECLYDLSKTKFVVLKDRVIVSDKEFVYLGDRFAYSQEIVNRTIWQSTAVIHNKHCRHKDVAIRGIIRALISRSLGPDSQKSKEATAFQHTSG